MTSEQLTMFASVLLSLVFSYVPGANTWFAEKTTNIKRLIMLGLLALISGAVFGMACWSVTASWFPNLYCTTEGLKGLLVSFGMAVIANQAAFSISPETQAVTEAKAARLDK
jgi:hypothetical protein